MTLVDEEKRRQRRQEFKLRFSQTTARHSSNLKRRWPSPCLDGACDSRNIRRWLGSLGIEFCNQASTPPHAPEAVAS